MDMKKIILNEEQVKRIIEQVISEQKASETSGGTDLNRITHALLSSSYGLPDGANHENYYYAASVSEVIQMSKTGDKTKYLSVFKPSNEYTPGNPKGYMDYIKINNDELNGKGSKTFNFNGGAVYATHNGLLALVRAMDNMRGVASILTISFGENKTGVAAYNERLGDGVQYNSDDAMIRTSAISMLSRVFCALACEPNSRKKGNFESTYVQNATNEQLTTFIQTLMNGTVIGRGGFMDQSKIEKLLLLLKPKGFVTEVKFDVESIAQKLLPLQNKPDFDKNKQIEIENIGKTFLNNLADTLKSIYMKNLEIYVNTLLPKNAPTIVPTIKNVNFNGYDSLGTVYQTIFNSKSGTLIPINTNITSSAKNYESGR